MTPRIAAHTLAMYLKNSDMTLACAESCTGGMAAANLSAEPGASKFFLGCVVAYSNSAKSRILGIPASLIEHHGAVSRETAMAMAGAARDKFSADCSFSITGIAGPDGGTPAKPVGTVWFGFQIGDAINSELHVFTGSRSIIRREATQWALDHLLKLLLQSNELDNSLQAGVSLK